MDVSAIILCVILTSAYVESLQVEYWEYKPKELSQACGGKPCLMKCCPNGEALHKRSNPTCRSITELARFNPTVGRDLSEKDFKIVTSNGSKSAMRLTDFYLFHGRKCLNSTFPLSGGQLLESGVLQYNKTKKETPIFCIDLFLMRNTITGVYKSMPRYLIWDEMSQDIWTEGPSYIYIIIVRCISSFFLLLVVVVYALLKRLRDKIFGVFVIAYATSMAMKILLQLTLHLNFIVLLHNCNFKIDKQIYYVLCPAYYFFCITSFFWLTFMSFTIWRCFRSVRNVASGSNIKKSFIKYWAAAWGLGGIMTGTLLVLDNSKSQLLPPPNFEHCLADTGEWYVHIPIAVCVSCNVIFYTLTFLNMRKIRVDVKEHLNKKLSKKNRKDKSVSITSVNMFLIMGASWVIDVVIAFTEFKYVNTFWQYVLLNCINDFNGVIIFIILVLKKRVIVMLRNRFKIKNKLVMNLVDSKVTTRMDTKYSKSQAKSTSENDSVLIEECSNFSQPDPGDGKQNSMRVYETIPEVAENDWDAWSDQRARTTTFKSNFIKPN